jgi:hypothetical protein
MKPNTLLASLFLLAACGGRTSPATQPAPAGWDPSKNDPKAVEAAQAMLGALGGATAWAGVKQIEWDVRVVINSKVEALYHHAWDLWNARHRLETTNMASHREAEAEGDPARVKKSIAMYRLFERDRGAAFWDKQEVASDDRKKMIATAYERWRTDAYLLVFPYKLLDPGVNLAYEGESKDQHCPDICDIIKVTFDPGVGEDTYYVNINRKTKLPDILEIQVKGKGRIAYKLGNWVDVGGLKLAQERDNLGIRDAGGGSEIWHFEKIEIDAPDDDLYVPQVH